MTVDEAIQRRIDEILADWPEDTPEQCSEAARILANANQAKGTPITRLSPRTPVRRAA